MMVSVDQFGIEIWQNYRHRKIIFRQCWFFIFQYTITINPIQRYYSHQHHSSSSAINTLLLYVSFKSTFVDFAFVFNMLALSAVLILFIVCVCVSFVVCLCVFRFSFCTGDVYVDFSTACV